MRVLAGSVGHDGDFLGDVGAKDRDQLSRRRAFNMEEGWRGGELVPGFAGGLDDGVAVFEHRV